MNHPRGSRGLSRSARRNKSNASTGFAMTTSIQPAIARAIAEFGLSDSER
jgi:hypothetical protein